MNAFPDDYVSHNLPFIVLSGLADEHDDRSSGGKARTWLSEGGFRIKTDALSVKGTTAEILLQSLLTHDSSNRPWHSRGTGQGEQPAVFHIQCTGRTYTLPPRKAGPPAHSPRLRPANDGSSPPPQLILHSTISPLTPSSPLYPDGIMTPLWITKHQGRLPSVFISFFTLVADPNTSTLQDNKLKSEINNIRSVLASTNYKSRLVIVVVGGGPIQGSDVEERLSGIRKGTSLDTKSLFFVAADSSETDIAEFSKTMLSSLYPGCIEYYRELSKHARRKRNRNISPQPTIPPSSGMAKTLPLASWNLRYEFKLAVFAEFRQEMEAALRSYEAAYEILVGTDVLDTIQSWSPRFNEARMLADIIVIRILRCVLWLGQTTNAVKWWTTHRDRVRNLIDRRGAGTETYGWEAWQSVWSRVMAELIQRSQVLSPTGGNSSAGASSALFIDTEKTLPAAQRYSPWESLHHEGYWLLMAQKHTLARRDRALQIPDADRAAPGQSPASAIASKAHLYAKYLALEPHQEFPLGGGQGHDYSGEVVHLLDTAVRNFSIRGQVRMAEVWQLKEAAELMRARSWSEAFSLLLSVWESQAWGKSGWWRLLEAVGRSLLRCASRLNKTDVIAQIQWQMVHPSVSLHTMDAPGEEGVEEVVKSSISLDTEHALSAFTSNFAFAVDECHVSEGTCVQISLHRAGVHTTYDFQLTQLKVVFEGGLRPISLIDDRSQQVDGSAEGIIMTELELTESQSGSTALASANVSLALLPSQTKIFQTYIVPREAGDVSVAFMVMSIRTTDGGEVTVTSSDIGDISGQWWEIHHGKPTSRLCGRQRDVASAKVLPKPPKVELSVFETRKNFYTNESIMLTVQAENHEEEAVVGSIEARLLSPGQNNAVMRWQDDQVPATAPTSDAVTFVQTLPVRDVERLEVGDSIRHVISISDTDEAIDHELEISVSYALLSSPETKLSKRLTIDMPVIRPFEANFSFHARLHEEDWPDFFSAQAVSEGENSITGIKQKYLVTVTVCSFALEDVVLESTHLATQKIVGDAICTTTPGALLDKPASPPGKHDSPMLIRPEETKRFGFDMTLQKSTLGNRDPVAVDVLLEIRWRRETSDQVNTSVLQVPRFLASSVEPRILLQVVKEEHVPGAYRLDYTIENPSLHFLTFNLVMESSDDFAFSGIKSKSLSLVPISRVVVVYRIMPTKRKAWVKVQLGVVDAYFGQTLKTQPASDGVRVDKQGSVLVWVE